MIFVKFLNSCLHFQDRVIEAAKIQTVLHSGSIPFEVTPGFLISPMQLCTLPHAEF